MSGKLLGRAEECFLVQSFFSVSLELGGDSPVIKTVPFFGCILRRGAFFTGKTHDEYGDAILSEIVSDSGKVFRFIKTYKEKVSPRDSAFNFSKKDKDGLRRGTWETQGCYRGECRCVVVPVTPALFIGWL